MLKKYFLNRYNNYSWQTESTLLLFDLMPIKKAIYYR